MAREDLRIHSDVFTDGTTTAEKEIFSRLRTEFSKIGKAITVYLVKSGEAYVSVFDDNEKEPADFMTRLDHYFKNKESIVKDRVSAKAIQNVVVAEVRIRTMEMVAGDYLETFFKHLNTVHGEISETTVENGKIFVFAGEDKKKIPLLPDTVTEFLEAPFDDIESETEKYIGLAQMSYSCERGVMLALFNKETGEIVVKPYSEIEDDYKK